MNEQEILGSLNIVQVEVTCTSGAVSKTDSGNRGDDVFTDGSVRYMDRKLLRPFLTARNAASRLCRSFGTRFLGGWAIPDTKLSVVRDGLEDITREFAVERAKLEGELSLHRAEWLTDHPEVGAYAHRFPTAAEVMSGISIQTSAFKINPQAMPGLSGGEHDGITQGVKGLAGQILAEIAQDARDAFSPETTQASARAKNSLVRAKEKLDALTFVDASLATVAKMIGDTLAVLPSTGPLRGQDFAIYAGLMNTLMQPKQVVATAAMLAISDKSTAWLAFGPKDSPLTPTGLIGHADEVVNPEPAALDQATPVHHPVTISDEDDGHEVVIPIPSPALVSHQPPSPSWNW